MRQVFETLAGVVGVVAVLLPIAVLTVAMVVCHGVAGLLAPLLVLGVVVLLLEIARHET